MYVVYNIDHIHHLLNEPKKSKFAYNSNRREYLSLINEALMFSNHIIYYLLLSLFPILIKLITFLNTCEGDKVHLFFYTSKQSLDLYHWIFSI
jgi:hypothetical protein